MLAVGLFAPASFAATSTKSKAVPKVVFVVGPAGAATNGYRSQARAAAAIARKYTPAVIELYSPNATWPAVRDALQGASLVVYMGHGNGWPSKYRDALYPPTQNGFGLNPKAGTGDYTHQYFGEASVSGQVKLAKNAIVLLNHLCYASGNTEPGLPEGNLAQAKQRVDNYAAGFIQAGASAVIAEAWSSPSYFVKTILSSNRSIQSAWSNAPSANRHRLAFKSERSRGYVAQMDTETATSGFTRSVVMKTGLASRDVLAGAAGSARSAGSTTTVAGFEALIPLEPTLIGTKLVLGTPNIKRLPSAGTTGRVVLGFKIKDRTALPTGMQASVRWDPIDVAVAPADPANEVVDAESQGAPAAPAAAAGSEAQPPVAPPSPPRHQRRRPRLSRRQARRPRSPRPSLRSSPRRRRTPRARRRRPSLRRLGRPTRSRQLRLPRRVRTRRLRPARPQRLNRSPTVHPSRYRSTVGPPITRPECSARPRWTSPMSRRGWRSRPMSSTSSSPNASAMSSRRRP